MKTSIIIPLYLDKIELVGIIDRCLKSYKPLEDSELILVDDASPLATPDEWPVTYKNPVNLGYTGNVLKGVELSKGKNIWIINDDIVFNDEVLKRMEDIEEDTIYLPRWGGDSMEDSKFGFFYGMTRKTWDKLGGLDPNMTHYFSDLDLWTRAKQMNIKIIKWDTIVLHVSGATYQGNQQLFLKDQKAYQLKHGRID